MVAGNDARYAQQQRVGAGFFRVLGVAPLQGREFTPDEDRPGGPAAVVVSYEFWRRSLAADPAALGRSITLRGEPYAVVGIMPEGFHSGVDAELWTPLRAGRDGEGSGENFQVVVRLRDATTWTQATTELERLGAEVLRRKPAPSDVSMTYGAIPLQQGLTSALRQPITMLAAAVAVVLLVATVNMAGLLLSRGARRSREIATRLALGSSRGGVIRQLLTESLILSVLGSLVGLVIAQVALQALAADLEQFGIWQPVSVDARAMLAAMTLAVLTTAVIGIVPSLQATRTDVHRGLAATGTRAIAGVASHWPRRVVVAVQIALGVVLLVSAGLLVRSFARLQRLDAGFEGRGVYAATVSLQDARYRTAIQVSQLVDATLTRLAQTPGIASATVSLGLPYERLLNLGFKHLDGAEAANSRGQMTTASYIAGDYFGTLGIPVRAGRRFTASDTAAAPGVAIVNETFAREYFDGASPIGRRIAVAGREREIVGLVGDVQLKPSFGGDRGPLAPMPLTYIPLAQASDGLLRLVHGWFSPSFIVRAPDMTGNIVPVVRHALDVTDPQLPLAKFRAMGDVQAESVAQPRFFMTLMLVLAGATVILVVIGMYGLIASTVAERTREMGIRLALGATAGQAVRALALPGVAVACAGTLAGIALARSATGLVRHQLSGVSAEDPATYLVVAVFLMAIAAAASILPAMRIARVEPASTLRMDYGARSSEVGSSARPTMYPRRHRVAVRRNPCIPPHGCSASHSSASPSCHARCLRRAHRRLHPRRHRRGRWPVCAPSRRGRHACRVA